MEREVNSEGMKIETEKSINSIHLPGLFLSVLFEIVIYAKQGYRENHCGIFSSVYAFEMTYDDSLFTTVTLTNTSNDLFML